MMNKILIIPDVHGREFWIEPCAHIDDYDKVIFLGDYVSPYPYEKITNAHAMKIFKEIIKFKKENNDKVVLLMGNHDFSYINSNICECRTDYVNYNKLNKLYTSNIKLFDLAWETTINDKRYFFSHAGVRKSWFNTWIKNKLFEWNNEGLPDAEYFNNLFHATYDNGRNYETKSTHDFEIAMGIYSRYRGWDGWDNGSIVWADINEYSDENNIEYPNVYFICGHTQLQDTPIVENWVADLDVRQAFVLNTKNGIIEQYNKK